MSNQTANFFQGEKVADTKNQLQRLVSSLPKPNDKSLLLQTVALFETLLSKIHDLQAENETLKTRVEVESENRSTTNDQMILEMELSRKDLQIARQVGLPTIQIKLPYCYFYLVGSEVSDFVRFPFIHTFIIFIPRAINRW